MPSISEMLRQAITESGLSLLEIQRATGVKRASIMRFLRGERSLRLDKADALAAYFGLQVTQRKTSKSRKKPKG
jgi:transcriptional regulator with XRE-family HTH domain